uniref:LIM and calponin homology domains-containing protein 1-like n=1 Tax=Oncorhynchus gorbuscha TaxID=8017 RepID=UPI001EAE9FFA
MASTGTEREEPHVPLDELRHPEPAFREAQKWIEEVTGKSFGEKDFRSGLENGILLCELLCSIRPGLVQKINRLPSPIAGLDNLSVFLRGCEELGLKGSQLFNPGDLQDTSIQANLRDSECSRKLKNVLITIFWLGKASGVCPSYDGPVLNLREFEGLRSHMRTLSEDRSGSDSVRPGVRDSGYDCWDSERSQSLSPRQHTRDNSLDSLDSFGSRSQTSPSPDVIIHGNSDVDSDGDAPNRKADVRRDDMLARRTSAGESRSFVPFNQFLPNRNVSAYVPTARRRSRPQDGEHGSLPQPILEEGEGGEGGGPFKRPPGPRSRNYKTVTWAPDGEEPKEEEGVLGQEEEVLKREVEEHRRLQRLEKAGIKVLPAVIRYGRPAPRLEQQEVKSPSPDIILRRHNDFLTNQRAAWDSDSEGEAEGEEGGGGVRRVPDIRRDDLASRRAPTPPLLPQRTSSGTPDIISVATGSMRGCSKVVTFGGVTELEEQPISSSREGEESQLLRRLLAKATVAMPIIALGSQLSEQQDSHMGGVDAAHTPPPNPVPSPLSPEAPSTLLELESRLAQYERRHPNVAMVVRPPVPSHCNYDDDDEDEEECPVPDLEKDDMLARRTRAYQHSAGRTGRSFNLFLPVPGAAQQKNTPSGGPNQLYQNTPSGFLSRSISIINMHSEEEGAGLLQPLGQSRYDSMQEQYTNHQEEEEEWQDDLARWKSRRRSASQALIRKEEERKRMERMMKEEEGGHTQKKKNIKTYREIVEDKERREAELCDAYRRAGSKEEAAMVLQHYALRFTISDSTLDSLQLPRTITTDQNPESRTITTDQNPESRTPTTNQNPESRTITTNQNPESRTITTDQNPESRTITTNQNPESRTPATNQNPESRTITTDQNPECKIITTDQNPESRTITTDKNPESKTITTDQNPESRTITTDQNPIPRTSINNQNSESRTITTDQNPECKTITAETLS